MNFNANAINTAISDALTSADKAADARIVYQENVAKLRGLLKGADRETVKGFVCQQAALHYNETYADGKWADSKCAAKRWANRVISDVVGGASPAASAKTQASPAASAKTQVKLSRVQKAAVKALLEAFGGNAKAAKAALGA
jgi:hypothetical protein